MTKKDTSMEHCPQEFKKVWKTAFAFLQKTLAVVLSMVLIACVPCTTQGSPHNAAAAANTKNIIFVVKPKKDFTISASIGLSYTSSMKLVAVSPRQRDHLRQYFDRLHNHCPCDQGRLRPQRNLIYFPQHPNAGTAV